MSAMRVAIADDELDFRDYLCAMLPRLDCEVVVVAENGRELVEQCASAFPDVVITDIRMPVLGGIEAAAQINEQRRVPVILISSMEVAATGLADHVAAYLQKPIRQSDLRPALARAFAQRDGHGT